jgi:hypothetical protein
MTIDMTKIRPGCILPCRKRVVESVEYKPDEYYEYIIKFVGDLGFEEFFEDGKQCLDRLSYKDITTIIEPSFFDWRTVKPGDAFTHSACDLVYYVGPDIKDKDYVVCGYNESEYNTFLKCVLTRAPEHDKEI